MDEKLKIKLRELLLSQHLGEEMVTIRLVPVEVFGAGMCDCGASPTKCLDCGDEVEGYGLMDAVSSWSDCNRATGQIYRVDDLSNRNEGEYIEVIVPKSKVDWFKKKWGNDE